jgi:hypothetical protein
MIPEAKMVHTWETRASIVAICWLEYDAGVLVLFSDGSTDVWVPKVGVSLEESRRDEIDLIHAIRSICGSGKRCSLYRCLRRLKNLSALLIKGTRSRCRRLFLSRFGC